MKEGVRLTTQFSSAKKREVLDEIIDNAISLPLESQELILGMAKAMRYTRECVMRQGGPEQACKTSEQMI